MFDLGFDFSVRIFSALKWIKDSVTLVSFYNGMTVFLLCIINKDILGNVSKVCFVYAVEVKGLQSCLVSNVLQNILFYLVWNDLRINHFWVSYPLFPLPGCFLVSVHLCFPVWVLPAIHGGGVCSSDGRSSVSRSRMWCWAASCGWLQESPLWVGKWTRLWGTTFSTHLTTAFGIICRDFYQ